MLAFMQLLTAFELLILTYACLTAASLLNGVCQVFLHASAHNQNGKQQNFVTGEVITSPDCCSLIS